MIPPNTHPLRRAWVMARMGWSMMFHDRARFLGTVLGVVFAVVLAAQQLGILFGLLSKNTMFVDNAAADVWIAPPGTELFAPGQKLPTSTIDVARTTPGVRVASPLIVGGATIKKPDGGTEAITLVGTDTTSWLGGPWSLVAGAREALLQPDTLIVEDADREKFGGLNLGSVREVSGRQVVVGGFTWGLIPFGPSYAFAEIDLARTMLASPVNRVDYVLVEVEEDQSPEAVVATLRARLPGLTVLTTDAFHTSIVSNLLRNQLGISFGTSTSFGLLIGFVVVALSMFSSVIDNLREYGTLKAIGCTNGDLTTLVLAQSVAYALIGSISGLFFALLMAGGIRSARLVVITPPWLVGLTPVVMLGLCLFAAVLALYRVRKLEPGMVFR